MRLNEDHCANQDGEETPDEYCVRKYDGGFCSKCEAKYDGCVEQLADIPPDCRPEGATSVADDGSTDGSAASTSTSSDGTTGGGTTGSGITTDADGSSGSGDTGIPEPECGNGVLEPDNGENCDGDQMPYTMCAEINLGRGELSCNGAGTTDECKYNFAGCSTQTFECHDGEIGGTEQCDDGDLADQTCETISENYIGGDLQCTECMFNTTNCELCHGNGDPCDTTDDCCAGTCLNLLGNKSCALG
ncbi:MAG TPA: hypothetical protein VFG69_20685 [Nannocystaceae bacterium]|nr:hypothetical protein [Nannocystaceae bacterium]